MREVDRFIKDLIPNNGNSPCEYGGNQIVITSRIVGYQMAALTNQTTHLTIEPMGERAIDRFCDIWIQATYRVSMPAGQWNIQSECVGANSHHPTGSQTL